VFLKFTVPGRDRAGDDLGSLILERYLLFRRLRSPSPSLLRHSVSLPRDPGIRAGTARAVLGVEDVKA
jgi:hypothetical protein